MTQINVNTCKFIRFPLNASKILMCKAKLITHHFIRQDKEEKTLVTDNLDTLLSFFEDKNQIDIVLAGFVSDVIEDLLLNEYKLVSDYLLSNLNIIENIIRHSYDYSVIKKIISPLVFQKNNGLSYSVIEDGENKPDKKLSKNLLIVSEKLINKLKDPSDEEACANILNMLSEAIDLDDDEKSRIEALEQLLYNEKTINIIFEFLDNETDNKVRESRKAQKNNLNLCLQTIRKLVLFYPRIKENKEDEESKEKDKQEKDIDFCFLIQNLINKIDFFIDTLKNQNHDSILDTRGDNKRLLSSTRIFVLRLINSIIKLNNSIINVHLSLSGIFFTIFVS